jgi:hypothetical protein
MSLKITIKRFSLEEHSIVNYNQMKLAAAAAARIVG